MKVSAAVSFIHAFSQVTSRTCDDTPPAKSVVERHTLKRRERERVREANFFDSKTTTMVVSEDHCQLCLDFIQGKRTKEEVKTLLLDGNEDAIESRLWKTWSGIVSAAVQVEATQHGVLVELLEDLKGHPTCIQARKEKIWGNEYAEDQLPIFGAYMREALDMGEFLFCGEINGGLYLLIKQLGKINKSFHVSALSLRKSLRQA